MIAVFLPFPFALSDAKHRIEGWERSEYRSGPFGTHGYELLRICRKKGSTECPELVEWVHFAVAKHS